MTKKQAITTMRLLNNGEIITSVGTKTALEIFKTESDVKSVIIGNRNDRIRIDRAQLKL